MVSGGTELFRHTSYRITVELAYLTTGYPDLVTEEASLMMGGDQGCRGVTNSLRWNQPFDKGRAGWSLFRIYIIFASLFTTQRILEEMLPVFW